MLHEASVALGPAEREELVHLAALLAADEATDAGEPARAALVAVMRNRSAGGDLAAAARSELVRRALVPPRGGREADAWATSTLSTPHADGFGQLRRELAALPPRTRAAVVLGRWAGWSDQEIGAALRSTVDTARTELVTGAAALGKALHPAAAYRRPVDTFVQPDLDRELRAALDGLARSAAASATVVPPADELRREAARARRRWWLAALAACCAVAVLTAAVVVSGRGAAPPERPEASQSPPAPRTVDVADQPTRGSLADDTAFLTGLLERPWIDDPTAQFPVDVPTTPESRRVLFAGDVPGGRWALLVGEAAPFESDPENPRAVVVSDELQMAWFVGPPGASPEEMTLGSYPYGITPGMVPGRLDPRTGTLVVVAAPGDTIEVSQRVDIDAEGQDSRSWATVETDDGIAVARLDPVDLPWTWSTVYRVLRSGQRTTSASPDGTIIAPEEQVPELDVDFPRPPSEEGRLAALYAATGLLSMTGLSPEEVDISALALVAVPSPAAGTVALVTVTLPSGATAVTAQWILRTPEGFPGGADCGVEIWPASASPEDGVLAARCELYDPTGGRGLGEVLVVRAPPQVDRVRLYRGDSTFLSEHEMPDDGVLMVPQPEGLGDVEAVTESGVLLGRTEPLGRWMPTS